MSVGTTASPDFVIIGAMKCATSTLHNQLAAQGGIYMSTPKEPNFFSDEDVFARGVEWYESLFASAPPKAIRGESSTHYSKRDEHPWACERLQRRRPDARLVYVMRNPLDRLFSHYQHGWTEGWIRSDIDQAILENPKLVLQGCYAWQIEPYLRRFGPDRILPVFFERLTRFPEEELERIARHIGCTEPVRWRTDLEAANRSADRRRPDWMLSAARRVPGLRTFARHLPQRALRRIEARWKIVDTPRLSLDSEQRLRRIFDRDLERLGRWLGRSLTCETYEEEVSSNPCEWSVSAKEAA